MSKKMWKSALLFGLALLVLAGCATRVRVEADRTPTMETAGIQRIAVMPFAAGDATITVALLGGGAAPPTREAVATTLTAEISSRIEDTGLFTLVSPSVINSARARGASLENYADALFTGRITSFSATTTQVPDPTGRFGPSDRRVVEIRFEYFFENTRDGTILGPVRRTGRAASLRLPTEAIDAMTAHLPGPLATVANATARITFGTLASYSTLSDRAINNQLRFVYRDVGPHTIIVTRTLENEPNRDLRPQMNEARALMRGGEHEAALDAYLAIWESYGSVAAAINAAILFEVLGDLEDAVFFLEQVYVETGNERVSRVIDVLNEELAELQGVAGFEDPRTPVEVVTEHALFEIEGVIAADANVWIQNVATTYQHLANEVADSIVYSFLGAGRTVVERGMIDSILAEQELHMTGMVADSDFISIGNLAGADTIIVIDMTGSARSRRLQVRVMDIAQGTLVMQSGTGVAWRL
ncbi:MAG: hypothetical protein FWB99_02240 [Treponema sp.]|nr:hypothetical protein [Treponema sp.]